MISRKPPTQDILTSSVAPEKLSYLSTRKGTNKFQLCVAAARHSQNRPPKQQRLRSKETS